MDPRIRTLLVAAVAAPLVIFQPVGAAPAAAPSGLLDVTGLPEFAPILAWSMAPSEDGASCLGGSSVKSPILPPGVDSWEVHLDWNACAPVVTFVGVAAPKALAAPPARPNAAYAHMSVTTRDSMSTSTGTETTVDNAQYMYNGQAAYIETNGGFCQPTGGWRLDSCTPDTWNFGPLEPRGAMLAGYHSIYWPNDYHNRFAVTGAYPDGSIQGECQESGSLPWARRTTCETRRGTTYP